MTNQNEVTTKQVVKQPMTFSQQELEQRQSQAREKFLTGHYITTSQGGYFSNPAANTESFNSFEDLLNYVEAQALSGNKRYPHILPIANPIFWQVSYYKPADEIEALLKEVDESVEQAYALEREEHNAKMKSLLASQMLAAEIAKEERKEADRLAKMKAKAESDANEYYNSLMENK